MRKTLVFFLFLFLSLSVFSQGISLDWVIQQGGSEKITVTDIEVDPCGNIVTTGYFTGRIDFDPGPDSSIQISSYYGWSLKRDLFVQKLSPRGELIWIRHIPVEYPGHPSYPYTHDLFWWKAENMEVDAEGSIYVAGDFAGTYDFDPGPDSYMLSTEGLTDVFVMKLDSQGDFVWAKRTGDYHFDKIRSIKSDASGNLYCTGESGSGPWNVDLDPGPGTYLSPISDPFFYVQKLDPSGNFLWAKAWEKDILVDVFSTTVDPYGDIILHGDFHETKDFDPGPDTFLLTSNSTRGEPVKDVFTCKISASGDFMWANQIHSSERCAPRTVLSNSQGEIYTTGRFTGTADFDPEFSYYPLTSSVSGNISSAYIQKLSAQGELMWAKQFDIIQDSTVTPDSNAWVKTDFAHLDNHGNLYVLLIHTGAVDADPGPGQHLIGDQLIWPFKVHTLVKLNPGGELIWAEYFNFNYYTQLDRQTIQAIDHDSRDNLYFAGFFDFPLDIDPSIGNHTLQPTGQRDMFVARFTQDSGANLPMLIDTITIDTIACNSFTLNDTVYSNTGIYYQKANPLNICGKVFQLKLSIQKLDTSVSRIGHVLTANEGGAHGLNTSYQWVDCSHGNIPIPGATSQSFVPTTNGSYAVIVSKGICSMMSACHTVYTVGIDQQFQSALLYYPNPSTGKFFIELGGYYQKTSVEVYDFTGQLIQSKAFISQDNVSIELPEETGLYLVKLKADEREAFIKVVKR